MKYKLNEKLLSSAFEFILETQVWPVFGFRPSWFKLLPRNHILRTPIIRTDLLGPRNTSNGH
jgi:hypothetical protein